MTEAATGSVLAGNPTGATPAGDITGDAPAAAPATPADWTASFDDSLRGVIQTKGWQSPADVVSSYANLEKLLGADKAGRALVPPKDDAAPEEWASFYGKLGRPDAPDGYKLPLPEGDTGEFAKTASGWFHEAGLTAKQAEALASKWNDHVGAMQQQQEATFAQTAQVEMQDLQREWGTQFEAQSELARRAIRESGLTNEEAQAVERALGLKKAAQTFAFLGKQFAEAPMKGGEGGGAGKFGATPGDAKARISALQGDAAWTAKYISGDAEARAEFARLHQIAYPDGQ